MHRECTCYIIVISMIIDDLITVPSKLHKYSSPQYSTNPRAQ